MQKQVHIFYSGRVQGVGFRFTAENIAHNLGIAGWVKNLKDGRVEVLAEAEEATLKDFLKKIQEHFGRYTSDTEINWSSATQKFSGFEVEF